MKTLAQVQAQFLAGEFDYSHHAFTRAVERNISDAEIREAGAEVQPVEEYPEDKYGPSWLVLGFTGSGRPLHMQVSMVDSPLIRIITVYEPDPDAWLDYVQRR